MTTEEIHNFNTGNEDTDIVEDLYFILVRQSIKWRLQPSNQEGAETPKGSNGRTRKRSPQAKMCHFRPRLRPSSSSQLLCAGVKVGQ